MKRWMQKLISVLMTLTLVLSLGATAFAEGENPDLTQDELEEQERQKKKEPQDNAAELGTESGEIKQVTILGNENLNNDNHTVGEVEAGEVEADEVETNEVETDEVEADEVETDEVETDEVETDEVETDEVETDEVETDEVENNGQDTNGQSVVNQNTEDKQINDKLNKSLPHGQKKMMTVTKSNGSALPDEDNPQQLFQPDTIRQDDISRFQANLPQSNDMPDENSDDANQGVMTLLSAKGATDMVTSDTPLGTVVQKEGKTVIEVDGKTYTKDKDEKITSGIAEYIAGGEVSYEKVLDWSASDGTLSLTYNDIKELTVKEGDLTIQAAGLNHIGNLVSNSVVNIIGTGILLLDDYDLKDSGEVKLTENTMYSSTGVTGSVAVFLKDKDASTENTYKLINSGIPGILDDFYTIPENYHLVLPSGESLIMNSTVATQNSESSTGYDYQSGDVDSSLLNSGPVVENSALLKVSKGASLTIEKGAEINMIATKSVADTTESGFDYLTPMIQLENGAELIQKGKLTGTGFVVAKSEGEGDPYNTVEAVGIDEIEAIALPIIVTNPAPIYEELKKTHIPNDETNKVTYEELKEAWNKVNQVPAQDGTVFIIKINGNTVHVKKDGEGFVFPEEDKWTSASMGNPYTGAGLNKHDLSATGSGLLGSGSFKFPAGSSKIILTAAEKNLWRVIVTENPKRGTWTLSVWYGDTQIFDLGVTTVRARFKFDKPDEWDTKNIYAVFIDKDGKSLKAFPATYDTVTGELVFDSSLVGEFVVVQFDYQGELYSKGFYDELAKLDAVKHLVDLRNGKAN